MGRCHPCDAVRARWCACMAIAIGLVVVAGCGRVSQPSANVTAFVSATPSASSTASSSPSASPTASPAVTDCVAQPTGAAAGPFRDNFHVAVRIPNGWMAQPPTASEIDMLVLAAPTAYSNQPTKIALQSLIGRFTSQTVADVAAMWYAPAPPNGHPEFNVTLVGQLMHCTVAGSAAAVFEYTSMRSQVVGGNGAGPFAGYMFVFLHEGFAYALRLEGTSDVDPQALQDAKAILGSWTWAVPS